MASVMRLGSLDGARPGDNRRSSEATSSPDYAASPPADDPVDEQEGIAVGEDGLDVLDLEGQPRHAPSVTARLGTIRLMTVPAVNAGPALPGQLLAELLPIVGEISAVLDPDELLPAIARQLRRIVDYRILDIFLPEPDDLLPAFAMLHRAAAFRFARTRQGCGAGRWSMAPVVVPSHGGPASSRSCRECASSWPPPRHLDAHRRLHRAPAPTLHGRGATSLCVLAGTWRRYRELDAVPRDALVRGASGDAVRDRQGDGIDPRPRRAAHPGGRGREARHRLRDVRHPAPRRAPRRAGAAQVGLLRRQRGEDAHQARRGADRSRRAHQGNDPRRRREPRPALLASSETRSELVCRSPQGRVWAVRSVAVLDSFTEEHVKVPP